MLHQKKILVHWRGIWDDMGIVEGWDDDWLQELELVKQENSQLSSHKRQVLMLDQETVGVAWVGLVMGGGLFVVWVELRWLADCRSLSWWSRRTASCPATSVRSSCSTRRRRTSRHNLFRYKSPLFFGGLECIGHSVAYVAHFVFLRYVWIRTQRAVVASRCATNLATHLPT